MNLDFSSTNKNKSLSQSTDTTQLKTELLEATFDTKTTHDSEVPPIMSMVMQPLRNSGDSYNTSQSSVSTWIYVILIHVFTEDLMQFQEGNEFLNDVLTCP